MLSVLAKLGSPSIVGQFALGLAITAPVYMLTSLQLRSVQATDARAEFAFSHYFTVTAVSTILGWIAIAALVVAMRYDTTTAAVIVLVSSAKAVESMSTVVAGLLQKHERLDRVAVSLIMRGVISVLVFGVMFAVSRSLCLALAGMVIVWSCVLLAYDLTWASLLAGPRITFFKWNWPAIRRLFILSLPLGIVMTLASLNVNGPRYFLQYYLGPAELGIFASLGYALVAIGLIVNALGQSASTRLSLMYAAAETRNFSRLIIKLISFGFLIIVLGVPLSLLIGRPILTVLYNAEYGQHTGLLAIMVAASGVSTMGSFCGYGVTAARQFRQQLPLVVCSTLSGLITSFVLIPRMGLVGAAVAVLVSAVVILIGYGLVLKQALKIEPVR
jgi:O-antigen/teichoic acid export membrane protein